MVMNVATRSRAKGSDAQKPPETNAAASPIEPGAADSVSDRAADDSQPQQHGSQPQRHDTPADDDENNNNNDGASVSVPTQNIRYFKEQVVNTSRLLKVFGDQEKELAKAKAELAKHSEEARRMHAAHQALQRDVDARARELASANAETENARSLLVLREEELSRVRGQREDLEARIVELSQAAPPVEHATPPKSPNVVLVEEIERLKRELDAKEGSLKSLRISRDAIRSSTKAEVMGIQAKYAREQKLLIERQERDMAEHRASLAGKEAELEQEQERLMQIEMDLSLRETQMEDQAAELKAQADAATKAHHHAQQTIKRLEEQAKSRNADHRAETNKLQRELKKSEKHAADMSAALKRAQDGARAAKSKQRPRSTATAAEAVQAATADLASMTLDELRKEVGDLRVDSVHQNETIRRYQVMLEELERKQNPEGSRPRGRINALEKEIEQLKAEVEEREKQIGALKGVLNMTTAEPSSGQSVDQAAAARIAQLDLKIIELEKAITERDRAIAALEGELKEAKDAANERPMRLRHAHTPTQPATPSSGRVASSSRRGLRSVSPASSQCEHHYAEIASLRGKVDKLTQERAALQELVTEQQVKIRRLRAGPSAPDAPPAAAAPVAAAAALLSKLPTVNGTTAKATPAATSAPTPTPAPRKRAQQPTALEDASAAGAAVPKRVKYAQTVVPSSSPDSDGRNPVVVIVPSKKPALARPKRPSAAPTAEKPSQREIKDILMNRRILETTRAKRCFDLMVGSPMVLQAVLARAEDPVPPIDTARFAELLIAHIHAEASHSSSELGTLPCSASLDTPDEKLPEGSVVAAKLQLLANGIQPGLYKHEAVVAMSVWVLVLKSEQAAVYDELMRKLSQGIVLRAASTAAAACSLARVFVALGVLAADIQRVRTMLCDLLMDAVDSPHALPVLANTLAIWPDVLRMPPASAEAPADVQPFELMVRVFQAIAAGIHDLYRDEKGTDEADRLYAVMVERCGWRLPGDAEFADTLLGEVKTTLNSLDRDSRGYPVVMAAFNLLAPYMP
ncbi:hypothetical protein LPJ63_001038 [Coemansia sp. RSA 2711]|nr:hypothetical protein LPJ63_001038 [Coemansia sp. RSA 2711]